MRNRSKAGAATAGQGGRNERDGEEAQPAAPSGMVNTFRKTTMWDKKFSAKKRLTLAALGRMSTPRENTHTATFRLSSHVASQAEALPPVWQTMQPFALIRL